VLFEKLGIEYSYTEDFIQYIAEIAVTKQSGARSLKMVFDDAISGALFKIFAGEYTSISLDNNNSICYLFFIFVVILRIKQ
jgi:ATP-dependent protease Clp ATPase subunit